VTSDCQSTAAAIVRRPTHHLSTRRAVSDNLPATHRGRRPALLPPSGAAAIFVSTIVAGRMLRAPAPCVADGDASARLARAFRRCAIARHAMPHNTSPASVGIRKWAGDAGDCGRLGNAALPVMANAANADVGKNARATCATQDLALMETADARSTDIGSAAERSFLHREYRSVENCTQ
jgi:hypothetical protein